MNEQLTRADTTPEAALLAACRRSLSLLNLLADSDNQARLVAILVMGRPVRDELQRAIERAESQ